MLHLRNVTKKFGKFTALENVNVTFNNGVYGLLSPNGAGKTTLMKMIVTLISPTSGEILWHGIQIGRLGEKYRDIVGFLPQDFGFYDNYSPKDFLLYIGALKGIAKIKIDELLEIVGLSNVGDKKMRYLSGGMIQRVGIAQAMLNNPKILILDEPTAGLDPGERVKFRNLISSLSKDRIVILSTHIVSDIETIADYILMIKNHRLIANDTPSNICHKLAGNVYVYETDNIGAIQMPYLALTERQVDGKTISRFICGTDGRAYAKPVAMTLEDIFLYVYSEV